MDEQRITRCKICKKPISYSSSVGSLDMDGNIQIGSIVPLPDDLKLERSCIMSRPYCQKCYLSYIKDTAKCDVKRCQHLNGNVCVIYPKVKSYIKKGGDIETMPFLKWADKSHK